jgi:hypothetical protein
LYQSIYDVLVTGRYIAFVPDGEQPITSASGMVMHLPAGLVEALGNPMVVCDASEIAPALFG